MGALTKAAEGPQTRRPWARDGGSAVVGLLVLAATSGLPAQAGDPIAVLTEIKTGHGSECNSAGSDRILEQSQAPVIHLDTGGGAE